MPLLVDDVYSCRFLPLAVVIYNLLASPVVFIACCCRLHRCSKLSLLLFLINQAVGLAFSWWHLKLPVVAVSLYWSSPSVFAVKCCRLLPSAVAFGLCHLLLLVSTARSRRSRLLMVIIGKLQLVRILENRFLVLASTGRQYKIVRILDKIITSWMWIKSL